MATLVDELSAVGVRSVPWRETLPAPMVPERVFLQGAPDGLEVAVATASKRPTTADLLKAWKARHGGRACPVLVVVTHPDGAGMKAAVCGPVGLEPPVLHDLDPGQVARLAGAAPGEPNRHAATRFILAFLPEAETELVKGANRAVAVFLDESESFDAPAKRFGGTTPVSSALALADRQHLSWVLLTRGPQVRLYPSRSDVGVGRKGRAETFVEINLALLPTDKAAYLDLLFSAAALDDNGTLADILERSADYAADPATRSCRPARCRRPAPARGGPHRQGRRGGGTAASRPDSRPSGSTCVVT